MRQRVTLLLTCSMRSRRWLSAWFARCCPRVSSWPPGFLDRHEDRHFRERKRQEAQILQQPAPRRQGIRRRVRNGLIMGAAAIGVAQEEDEKQGVDQQDIFHCVIFFRLFRIVTVQCQGVLHTCIQHGEDRLSGSMIRGRGHGAAADRYTSSGRVRLLKRHTERAINGGERCAHCTSVTASLTARS